MRERRRAVEVSRRSLILSGTGALLARLADGSNTETTPQSCSPCDESMDCLQPMDFKDCEGVSHRVYTAGEGPPVVLLHELPGLTPQDIRLAKMLTVAGYTVLLPLLFGSPGDDHFFRYFSQVCGKDQFNCGGSGRTPKPVEWIRDFCESVRDTWKDGLGIGVIGMCLTGEFPLALLNVPSVKAAVLCQPTDPFNLLTLVKLGPGSKLSLSDEDLRYAQCKSKVPILGIRYTEDKYCPGARFDTLGKLFPERFYRLDLIHHGNGHHHSSLGEDLCDVAFDEVCLFLGKYLKGASDKPFPGLSALPANFKEPVDCPVHVDKCKS